MIAVVRWLVTLSGGRRDVEFLIGDGPNGLSAVQGAPRELLLELVDPEGDATADDASHEAWAVIDAYVRRVNGFARLRWGRAFEGVSISKVETIDAEGHATQLVRVGTAHDHMLFEDFADMVERMGHPRPDPPAKLEVIEALGGEAVTMLATTNPDVARVLHLVDLMLDGDEEIDWVAAYSALEVIEHNLSGRGLDGRRLDWWTRSERERFRATANSSEILGVRARHGSRRRPPPAPMTSKDASWFVRRVAALWVTDLLSAA